MNETCFHNDEYAIGIETGKGYMLAWKCVYCGHVTVTDTPILPECS